MVGHEEAHAERPGDLDIVADAEVAEIIADNSAHRAALVILQYALHGQRDVVVARPLAVAGARDRILPRMMRPAARIDAGRNDPDRLPFEHRKRHRAEIEHDVMGVVVLACVGHPNIADDGGGDRSRRGLRTIEVGVRTGGRPGRDHGRIGADFKRHVLACSARRGLRRASVSAAVEAPAAPSSSAVFADWNIANPSIGGFVTTQSSGTLEVLLHLTQSAGNAATTNPSGNPGSGGGGGPVTVPSTTVPPLSVPSN